MNTDVDFDLRYLVGDFTTKADLALNVGHLENPSLWSGNKGGGEFSPWYWPALLGVARRRRAQIEFVAANVDQSILRSLEFPDVALASLSRHAKGALSPDAGDEQGSEKPLIDVTFREFFVSSSKSIPAKEDRETFSQNNSAGVLAKVIAGELDGWFRRDVLGPQDVLVDVPHLLLRMPFVLGDDAANLGSWNGVVNAKEPPFGLSEGLFEQHLKPSLFSNAFWLESPAFWWPTLKANTALNQLFLKSEAEWGDYVFCEDTSSFVPRSGEALEPVEFAAEYDGVWNRRHVARLKEFKYAPRSRLRTL
jgi:hypothetical protein